MMRMGGVTREGYASVWGGVSRRVWEGVGRRVWEGVGRSSVKWGGTGWGGCGVARRGGGLSEDGHSDQHVVVEEETDLSAQPWRKLLVWCGVVWRGVV